MLQLWIVTHRNYLVIQFLFKCALKIIKNKGTVSIILIRVMKSKTFTTVPNKLTFTCNKLPQVSD